ELGWELYMPIASGLAVWDALWEAGTPRGLRAVGYRAVDSLRLEKGYRYWSADVTPDYTPYEAGQGFCVKADRKDFQGKEALLQQREEGITRKLCCLVLNDPAAHPLGNEPVLADGRIVSRVTSGGIGYTVQESLAYAYLPSALTATGTEMLIELDGQASGGVVDRADGGTDSGTGGIAFPGGAILADRDRGVLAEPPGGRAVPGAARSGARFSTPVAGASPRAADSHFIPPDVSPAAPWRAAGPRSLRSAAA